MRTTAPIRILGLPLAAGLGLSVSGCAQPAYRFVGNTDRDVVFRVPHDGTPVDDAKALKAGGIDPGSETGWTAFSDGSAHPGMADVADSSADHPLLFAETVPLTEARGAQVTPDALRDLLLPGTADDRTAAAKAHVFAVLGTQAVSRPGESGAQVRYSYLYLIGSTPEIFDAWPSSPD